MQPAHDTELSPLCSTSATGCPDKGWYGIQCREESCVVGLSSPVIGTWSTFSLQQRKTLNREICELVGYIRRSSSKQSFTDDKQQGLKHIAVPSGRYAWSRWRSAKAKRFQRVNGHLSRVATSTKT